MTMNFHKWSARISISFERAHIPTNSDSTEHKILFVCFWLLFPKHIYICKRTANSLTFQLILPTRGSIFFASIILHRMFRAFLSYENTSNCKRSNRLNWRPARLRRSFPDAWSANLTWMLISTIYNCIENTIEWDSTVHRSYFPNFVSFFLCSDTKQSGILNIEIPQSWSKAKLLDSWSDVLTKNRSWIKERKSM